MKSAKSYKPTPLLIPTQGVFYIEIVPDIYNIQELWTFKPILISNIIHNHNEKFLHMYLEGNYEISKNKFEIWGKLKLIAIYLIEFLC